MKKILILGSGCYRCNRLHQHVLAAVEESGVECEVFKVSDPGAIAGFGVMTTPALIVDGELKSSGKLLTTEEIRKMLSD